MGDWYNKPTGIVIIGDMPLKERCVIQTSRIRKHEGHKALEQDECYMALAKAIFLRALFDFFELSAADKPRQYHAKEAEEWIASIDSLWFIRCPDISGKELIDKWNTDLEAFTDTRYALMSYRWNTKKRNYFDCYMD